MYDSWAGSLVLYIQCKSDVTRHFNSVPAFCQVSFGNLPGFGESYTNTLFRSDVRRGVMGMPVRLVINYLAALDPERIQQAEQPEQLERPRFHQIRCASRVDIQHVILYCGRIHQITIQWIWIRRKDPRAEYKGHIRLISWQPYCHVVLSL